jgi:hypothetical protein
MVMINHDDLSPLDLLSMPGSKMAVNRGCKCDPEKNNHGRGMGFRDGRGYDVSEDCPLYLHRVIGSSELAE